MFKKRKRISPVMTFIILIIVTILLSGFLHLLKFQSEYTTVSATGSLLNNVVEVKNLFSTSGIKYIVTHAVKNFMSFTPMSILIIVLIFAIVTLIIVLDVLIHFLRKQIIKYSKT